MPFSRLLFFLLSFVFILFLFFCFCESSEDNGLGREKGLDYGDREVARRNF